MYANYELQLIFLEIFFGRSVTIVELLESIPSDVPQKSKTGVVKSQIGEGGSMSLVRG